ncbi:MAG: methylated-DNA--[protein]-cysteine S-methyltransferase [Bacteroidales bacterium]|nr:methylated-DNA--[protein]-cysteine S-methyltransferase [Bacteroidales bacterium]
MKNINVARYESAAGELILGEYEGKLCLCDWVAEGHREAVDRHIKRYICAEYHDCVTPVIELTIRQLDEYFRGERRTFDVPLMFVGTEFQQTVRTELTRIPYGATISYAELARRVGNPKAVRAVAAANAINPVSIIVPCHRVIGSNGSMTGYGGGLTAKKFLLELETHTEKKVE